MTECRKRRLTPRQLEWLQAVQGLLRENRMPPTHRELASVMGVNYRCSLQMLLRLERKGYVDLDPNRSRGIRLRMFVITEALEHVPVVRRTNQLEIGPWA